MNIKEIQEYNRKKIICAVHGTDDYEAALKMELERGCRVEVWDLYGGSELTIYDYMRSYNSACFIEFENNSYYELINCIVAKEGKRTVKLNKIIGKPITLDRILIALEKVSNSFIEIGLYANGEIYSLFGTDNLIKICKWDLTKQTLEEQTEETQLQIAKLLGYKQNKQNK